MAKPAKAYSRRTPTHHHVADVPTARAAVEEVNPGGMMLFAVRIRHQAVLRIHAVARSVMAANRSQRGCRQQSQRNIT